MNKAVHTVRPSRSKIEAALFFVQDNLGDALSVARVAAAVGMSESHLHRVFHEAMGESVGRFITRKRMETAALRLVTEQDTPATTIGLDVGYSSSANFSKAFKLYFGVSPSEARRPSGQQADQLARVLLDYGHRYRPEALFAVPHSDPDARAAKANAWQSQVRFEERTDLNFVCMASVGAYGDEALLWTWQELIKRCQQLGVCGDEADAWGMAHDSPDLTAEALRRYHACVLGETHVPVRAPLFRRRVEGGRFAVFPYSGPVGGVAEAYKAIYTCWFPESSVVPGDYVPLDHYVADEPVDGHIEMEMWFRVRPA